MTFETNSFVNTKTHGNFKEASRKVESFGPNEILINMLASGICHTDCYYLYNEGMNLGHEPVGLVQEVGSAVTQFTKGDYVGEGELILVGFPTKLMKVTTLPLIMNFYGIRGSLVAGHRGVKPQVEEYPFTVKGLEDAMESCETNKACYRAIIVRDGCRGKLAALQTQ
ncbi:chaperonin 10-like protein [Chlamydoabsidia padenii]|nr:chaperonin 10-like protein [Chlamydoabsidia padenii]